MLADLRVSRTAAFKNLAASAHHWQPLRECAIAQLSPWLAQQAGYTRVALAADATATPLAEFAFPKRSILVLGQELTGIPADIVAQCDCTITIPQFGLVESLNVQTAGAIAIYEYVRQHSI